MNVGLYRGASSLVAKERELEAISNNLANLGTNGYKRVGSATREFAIQGSAGKRHGLATRHSVDFSQGDLTRTGRPYDLALSGSGFFAVEAPRGEVYTRDGAFQTTEEGVLITSDGHPVAWERLQGPIDPTGLPVVIDGEGSVSQGGQEIGQLRIVDFVDPGRLRQINGGYWAAPRRLGEKAHEASVHQGALERSNAGGVNEMVELISVQRSFENVARVITSIEESYSRLTRPF